MRRSWGKALRPRVTGELIGVFLPTKGLVQMMGRVIGTLRYLRFPAILIAFLAALTGPAFAASDPGFDALKRGDYARAERYLRQTLAEYPNDAFAIMNMGVVYEATSRPDLARTMYQRVIEMAPQTAVRRSTSGTFLGEPLVNLARRNMAELLRNHPELDRPTVEPAPVVSAVRPLPGTPAPVEPMVSAPLLDDPIEPYDDYDDFETDEPLERFGAQLAAYRSRSKAENGWSFFMEKYADLLGFLDPEYVEVDIPGKGTFHRLIAVSLSSRAEAKSLCDALIDRGAAGCIPKDLAQRREVRASVPEPKTPEPQLPELQVSPTYTESPGDRIGVQLAAFRSRSNAERGWQTLSEKYAHLIGDLQPYYIVVDVPGKGEFHRLVAGPLDSRSEANSLCQSLKSEGAGCMARVF